MHVLEILNFHIHYFPILIFVNIFGVLFTVYLFLSFNRYFEKIIEILIFYTICLVFIHMLFIWRNMPEVYFWTINIYIAILLFTEGSVRIKFLFFSTILFLISPNISNLFNLSEYHTKQVKIPHDDYLKLLFANFIINLLTSLYIVYFYISNYKDEEDIVIEDNHSDEFIVSDLSIEDVDLTKIQFAKIYSKILIVLEENKGYTNPNYSLKILSNEVASNMTYVSKAINLNYNGGFKELINKYRIDHFKKLVQINKKKKIKIKELYLKSGFTQQSTFNRIFKQLENCTPIEYIKKQSIE